MAEKKKKKDSSSSSSDDSSSDDSSSSSSDDSDDSSSDDSSDDSSSSSSSSSSDKSSSTKEEKKTEEVETKVEANHSDWQEDNEYDGGYEGGSAAKAFQRVDVSKWMGKKGSHDNSYEAAFGNDGWGARASAVLRTVRGKDFRHEKTKKKRGSYRGGIIDVHGVNSIKFAD